MVVHLAQQKRKCMNSHTCVYRGPDGMKCIVGALLTDATAKAVDKSSYGDTSIGTDWVWALAKEELALSDLSTRMARTFYKHMQNAHDNSKDLEQLKKALKVQALKYGLKPGKVNGIKEWQ